MTYNVRQLGGRVSSAILSALVLVLWPGFAVAQDQEVAIAVPHISTSEEDVSPAQLPRPNKKALRTRFVIGVDREVDARVFALRKPDRVIIDLPDINMRLPEGEPVGLVKRFRGGLSAPGRARVVIDVTQPVVVEKRELTQHPKGGYRLAIEFAPVSDAIGGDIQDTTQISANDGSPKLGQLVQPPLPQPALRPQERAKLTFKPLIVIDPGHGGYDTGAKKNGVIEKQVVLAFSLELRKQLEATGRYRIKMTRDTDVFIPLDDRVAFGERHGANLFIAVHADYAGSRARGATIYSLRDRVAKRLKRSALDSINTSVLSMTERAAVNSNSTDARVVQDILSDLAARDVATTQARTGMFAQTVIENMGESTRMRPKPDQQAAFRVLKTAQFPSVLIELAFVTNRIDARNLKSDEWRSRVAESIATAVDSYFAAQEIRLPL